MTYDFDHDLSTSTSTADVGGPTGPEDRNFAVLLHVGTLAALVLSGGFVHVLVPAVALFVLSERSAWLRAHVKEQLNFQLTFLIVCGAALAITIGTLGLGVMFAAPLVLAFIVIDVVATVLAALAASRGEAYHFPLCLRLLR
jgi:uncharacterized Tic20 family protein